MAGLRRALFVHRCSPRKTLPYLKVLQQFLESSPASTLCSTGTSNVHQPSLGLNVRFWPIADIS